MLPPSVHSRLNHGDRLPGAAPEADGASPPSSRVCDLVRLLLRSLDTVNGHIEDLGDAFQAEDPHRALVINTRLAQACNDAFTVIFVLEQVSGCVEVNARAALDHMYQNARGPLALASSLISRVPAYLPGGIA